MTDDKLRATPAARKLADDLGINLYDVSGTGAKGRIHKEDIESYREFNIVKITPLQNVLQKKITSLGRKSKGQACTARL